MCPKCGLPTSVAEAHGDGAMCECDPNDEFIELEIGRSDDDELEVDIRTTSVPPSSATHLISLTRDEAERLMIELSNWLAGQD